MKIILIVIVALVLVTGCSRKRQYQPPVYSTGQSTGLITDSVAIDTIRIEETDVQPVQIVFIRDTVSKANLQQFFAESYSELFSFAAKNQLITGKTMAFYNNYNEPVALEAAVEVNRMPRNLSGRVLTRKMEGGNALVFHHTGPYELMVESYSILAQWMKDNGKQAKGLPFEVYLNSPDMVKDSSELRTDIYQLIQ